MERFELYSPQCAPLCAHEEYIYFRPDFTQEQELYRVDNQPVNLIDNSQNNPALQNVLNQLPEYTGASINTSGLSDKQLADSCIPRFAEVSDFEDIAGKNLSDLSKLEQSQIKND